jgi:hypothetical protein
MTAGTWNVWLYPPGQAPATNYACLVDTISVKYGRDDADSQPEAMTVTLDLSLDSTVDQLPPGLDIGWGVQISVDDTAGRRATRFAGKVTDVSIGWDEADEDTPNAVLAQIIAVSAMADLGRRVVGAKPWSQELDGKRVSRILKEAGYTQGQQPWYLTDPGTVQILPRDVDSQPALDLIHSVAESAGGVLWEGRTGWFSYGDALWRHSSVVALVLDACDLSVTPTWRRTLEGLVNDVSIGYGPTPEGGEQPRYLASDETSVAAFGRYQYTAATELAAAADAQAMASLLLVRNSEPVWIMASLPIDVLDLDLDRTWALLTLDMTKLVQLEGLPYAGDAPTTAVLWVEGWQETITGDSHLIELAVSGYCRTAPPPQWDEVDAAMTWDTAPGTWDDATCWGPRPNQGRWADVPASLRWNYLAPTYPAGITWDQWPSG